MAVYTSVKKSEIETYLMDYDIDKLVFFEGIVDGIENTNFKIVTQKGEYILTLFEKRVDPNDLPFFMNLQKHLSNNGFNCPLPIENTDKVVINSLCNKKSIIISFLRGKKINKPNKNHCFELGKMISNFQIITKTFKETRKNSLNVEKWISIYKKCLKAKNNDYMDLYNGIDNELVYLEKKWPKNLPSGIIHADIFQDNVFFDKENFSGLIDFYFSCNDFYAYELAITTNAWCFDSKNNFNINNFYSILDGYKINSVFSEDEKNHFNTLLRGAAMRILITRLHDQIFHPDGAMVVPKDPIEYFKILKWHQNNSVFN